MTTLRKCNEEAHGFSRKSNPTEITLYTISVENFERADEDLESLFGLIERKLYEFADASRHDDSSHSAFSPASFPT
jgi:tritrans,polycis-undecaprenyl-diphosphate synthase [geranylgeranyl-diphosphate specific]